MTVLQRWLYFIDLIGAQKPKNILIVIKFLLSIFPSNAFTARIFSVMAIKWRDERNRSTADLIKNELCVYFNNDENCSEFYKKILSDNKLLNKAHSSEKYM